MFVQSSSSLLVCFVAAATVVCVVSATGASFKCSSVEDCELLGECVSGVCRCQPGWTGPTCGQLKLVPASSRGSWPTTRPIPPSNATMPTKNAEGTDSFLPNSWGASIVKKGPEEYHMFVDTGCFDAKTLLHEWGYQLSHGVSPNVTGPYTFSDTTVGPTSFNPHITVMPDGTYVLYHLYQQENPMTIPRCFGNESAVPTSLRRDATPQPSPSHRIPASDVNDDVWKVRIAYSTSLYGPWTEKLIDIVGYDGDMMNPSAYVHANGSVLLAYTSLTNPTYSWIFLAYADHWNGTYTHVGKMGDPLPNVIAEDPYLWRNPDGTYHMILHMYQWYGPWSALHAFSGDGLHWNVSSHVDGEGMYNTTVQWDDGTSTLFYRRERPELIFDDKGGVSHLLTSLEYGADHPGNQYSFTLIQKIDTA